jgi:hypothetical protein
MSRSKGAFIGERPGQCTETIHHRICSIILLIGRPTTTMAVSVREALSRNLPSKAP